MNTEPTKTAIIYTRVSSAEQVSGTSLEMQERECKRYAQMNELNVVQVFSEQGESAKTADRTEFQKALKFCSVNKVGFFIVHKIDRFSRNTNDHVMTQAVLKKIGTILVSASEPIDQTSMGRAMEGMLSVWAELDNNIRADRSRNGMIERVKQGVWVWEAPLGYKRVVKGGNIVIDPDTAHYIQLAFEEWSKGVHTYRSLAKFLYERGLRTRTGKKVYPQMIQKMLRNPIYYGLIQAFELEVIGAFEPIINESLFYKCQPNKRKTTRRRGKARSTDFPLRGLAYCSECGERLTASYSRGNGGKYAYYHHQKGGCIKNTYIPKETLEQNFTEFLGGISPKHKKYEKAFKAVVMDVWQKNYQQLDAENAKIRKEIAALEDQRQKIFQLHRDEIYTDDDFKEQNKRIRQSIEQKRLLAEEKRIEEFNMEEALGYCFEFVRDSASTWEELQKLPSEYAFRFQKMLFPDEKLTYNGDVFGTDKMSLIYEINQQAGADKSKLVTLPGIEPGLPP